MTLSKVLVREGGKEERIDVTREPVGLCRILWICVCGSSDCNAPGGGGVIE